MVQQNRAGKSNLSEFIANRGQRAVYDALQLAKEFMEAEAQLATSKKVSWICLRKLTKENVLANATRGGYGA